MTSEEQMEAVRQALRRAMRRPENRGLVSRIAGEGRDAG